MAKSVKNKVNIVYNNDARDILSILSSDTKIKTTITSPPYYDMKDYGSNNQIGFGQSYEEYLEDLKSLFSKILTITENDGSLWIIIDTFKRNNQVVTLPFDLANKLKECGWLLQDIIIWKKDKTVPWSAKGFMQRKFEYILFLSKTNNFKYNKDRVRTFDTNKLKRWWVKYPERYNPKGKALDEIWEFPIPVQGSWGDQYIRHFCPLPQEMVATMIDISSDKNDIILDPFAGSGSVLFQSEVMDRNYIGFELNEDYISMFKNYQKDMLKKNKEENILLQKIDDQLDFQETILNLRVLKYARLLNDKIEKHIKTNTRILVRNKDIIQEGKKFVRAEFEIIGEISEEDLTHYIKGIISKPPFSKFGIEPIFEFSTTNNFPVEGYFGYTKTNSYSYSRENLDSSKIKVISQICVDLNENNFD